MRVDYKEFAVNCKRLAMKDKAQEQLMEEIELLRKELEALRESKEQYRTFVEASQDALVEVDEKGRIILWNRGAKQNFGYSAEEILGEPATKLMAGKYRERYRRSFESLLNENNRLRKFVEGEGLRKDGSRFPIEWSLSRWKENGRTMFAAIGKDITERMNAERERKHAEELYTTFANSSQIGVYIVQDRRFQFVNPQFQSYTGLSRDEVLGMDSLTIVHPEDREMVRENAVKMLKGERSSPYQFRAIAKGGETKWAIERVVSIQYRGKRATLGSYMDISEVKRAEEALRGSEKKYRTLFDSTLDGLFVIEAETMKVVLGNQAAAEVYGFNSVEEAIGVAPLDFIPPDDRERVLKLIVKNMFEEDLRQTHEFWTVTKDGREIWISAVGTRIEHQGKLAGLVSFRDITRQKKAEEQLKHSFINLAETISRAVESRDPYTAGHQWRVAELARLVGEKMGLDSDTLQGLYIGGLLHDIGKISTPESILSKPGKLTEEEWGLIRAHTKQGYKILKNTELPWPVIDMAVHHHERLDGSGYPHSISGDKLSLEVRILAVCDVAEAMSSHRPYRPARSKEEVVEKIKGGRGIKYDAEAVDTVLQIIENGEFEFGWRVEAQLARV